MELDRGRSWVTLHGFEYQRQALDTITASIVRRLGHHRRLGNRRQALELPSTRKMQRALALLQERAPELEVEGEMHGDAALSEEIRLRVFPNSRLHGPANLLIMPTLDAANIAFNLLKTSSGDGITIGPILLGARGPAHILTPSATVRRIINMTTVAVVDAQAQRA